jgi:hypothetical protein
MEGKCHGGKKVVRFFFCFFLFSLPCMCDGRNALKNGRVEKISWYKLLHDFNVKWSAPSEALTTEGTKIEDRETASGETCKALEARLKVSFAVE